MPHVFTKKVEGQRKRQTDTLSQGWGKISYFSLVEICVERVHPGTMGQRIRKLEIASVEREDIIVRVGP